MTIVLYLLGFSGSDVRGLRKRRWFDGDGPGGSAAPTTTAEGGAPKESSKRFMVQVRQPLRSLETWDSLVGGDWNMTFMDFHVLGIIILIDFHIFQRS